MSVNGYVGDDDSRRMGSGFHQRSRAVRCAWLTNGAVLNGFTLENGATPGPAALVGDIVGKRWRRLLLFHE